MSLNSAYFMFKSVLELQVLVTVISVGRERERVNGRNLEERGRLVIKTHFLYIFFLQIFHKG